VARRPDLARRAELAAAAFEVLHQRGHQISMRELAEALGIKRPTLYFYFPDQGAIFEAVLAHSYRALAEAVVARTRALAHPLDRLAAVVVATLEFHRARPQLIAALFQLWALGDRDPAALLEREREVVRAARGALIADLRDGIACGEVLPCDPARIVDLVFAVVDGVLVHHVLGIARPDEVVAELALRVIDPLRPVRPFRSPRPPRRPSRPRPSRRVTPRSHP
jgi:AcrR family transcriptional regulator